MSGTKQSLIINSPYEEPGEHLRYDRETRLKGGEMLVLEVKGQDSAENQTTSGRMRRARPAARSRTA
jgi:hypothetical protein